MNQAKQLITKIATFALEKPAAFLKYSAAINFSIGSIGLIAGMLINDKIPKKEKRFMIAQESVEGVLDLGVFLGLATGFEKFGKSLVEKGKLLPALDGLNKAQVKDKVVKFFKQPHVLSDVNESTIRNFVKGTEVATSLIGTVVAFNIVTPLIRNFLASKIEKKFAPKTDESVSEMKLYTYFKTDENPFSHFQNALKQNTPLKTARINPSFTSTGLKI
ncbi:MAG: hypothetical protein ACD_20C00168G0003 [uncultured bacterium]|nr:MAG: hypothetical protein ACD_20C00168G0003 [uncultured bacterium]HBH17604.1 hypothetical protein [Cyanobacteria bacterium UBA9579]